MAAAVVIRFRYACGYEYTGVPPQDTRPPITHAGYIPKKVKQNVSHGAKNPGENLFSCYPEILLILLFLVCII